MALGLGDLKDKIISNCQRKVLRYIPIFWKYKKMKYFPLILPSKCFFFLNQLSNKK